MSMADRIAILNYGNVMQVGSPFDVYYYPDNIFVAGFIGSPQMNFMNTTVEEQNGKYGVSVFGNFLELSDDRVTGVQQYLGGSGSKKVVLGMRPEHLFVGHEDHEAVIPESHISIGPTRESQSVVIEAEVFVVEHLGASTLITLDKGDVRFAVSQDGYFDTRIGDTVKVRFYGPSVYLFDPESEKSVVAYEKIKDVDSKRL